MPLERESTSMQSTKVNSKPGAEFSETKPRVALFVTCLVNTIRPSVGFSAISLLESCLLYTSPSPRDKRQSRMPSSA